MKETGELVTDLLRLRGHAALSSIAQQLAVCHRLFAPVLPTQQDGSPFFSSLGSKECT